MKFSLGFAGGTTEGLSAHAISMSEVVTQGLLTMEVLKIHSVSQVLLSLKVWLQADN